MSEDKHLTHPAAALARRAPEEWAEFKKAFRMYEGATRDNLVKAAAGDLAKFQGMALQCAALAALFDDAIAASDRAASRVQGANTKR